MWILHDDDGQEIGAMRRVRENGELVEKLVPVAEEAARMSEAMQASKPKPEAKPAEKEPEKPSVSPLEATLILARRGNREILPRLREVLDKSPELWRHFGNLAMQAQESWLGLIAGKDLYLAESLRRHLDAMRSELVGPNSGPLDRLLVDRILACHVQTLYFEAVETTDPAGENMRVARYRMDRRDQAHRQFLSAMKMLATVRNLTAKTNVIQAVLLTTPMVQSPAAPALPAASGNQPQGSNGHTNGRNNRFDAEVAKPGGCDHAAKTRRKTKASKKAGVNGSARRVNGHNRINGNRVAHLLGIAASDDSG